MQSWFENDVILIQLTTAFCLHRLLCPDIYSTKFAGNYKEPMKVPKATTTKWNLESPVNEKRAKVLDISVQTSDLR